jgi:AraC-like DNA-binding protein
MILDKAVTRTKDINLEYNQNTVKMQFSALNYFRPMQTYYRVRVKGIGKYEKWKLMSHGLTPEYVDKYGMLNLTLLNLNPGRYEIELQASMTLDNWQTEPYVWTITVHQPWWRSTGIYYLLILVIFGLLLANFLIFNKNMKMSMIRHNEEIKVVARVKQFANRCEAQKSEILTPNKLMQEREDESASQVMSKEFVEVMLKLVPYIINEKNNHHITMKDLEEKSQVSKSQLYYLLSTNVDKNPQQLVSRLRLEEAAQLVRTTTMDFEKIAEKCHYVSPNYFFAAFYHHFRMTPSDYRNCKEL